MSTFNVALLQATPCGNDQPSNLSKGETLCRYAKSAGADLALFPEMWNIGYSPPHRHPWAEKTNIWRGPQRWVDDPRPDIEYRMLRAAWQAQAISQSSAFFTYFRSLAKELDMAIALTYLQEWPVAPRNVVSIIDRHGEVALTYAKVHTCDFDEMECACTPGEDFHVCKLDTAGGEVMVGSMICFDREFPESARVLMLKGAEIILVPNSCEIEQHRLAQLRTRAYENMVGVALANYAAPKDNGHSVAYSPIAFDARGSRDTLIIEGGAGECVLMASFDMDAIRTWRGRETWGNAFRKPHRYTELTSMDVASPFVRVNRLGERYDQAARQR